MVRCIPGCRVCGVTTSSGFREWATYADREGFQGVQLKRPTSTMVCDPCRMRLLKVSPPQSIDAYSSRSVITLQVRRFVFCDCFKLFGLGCPLLQALHQEHLTSRRFLPDTAP